MKSVAIVGFSDKTLKYVKDTDADQIWTLNHAYLVLGKTIPRIDALFEIHKKDWFLRKEVPRSAEYWEWLKQPHPFPIYMQKPLPEVPSSVEYPFDEVVQDVFRNHLRRQNGEYIRDVFLTSSASAMLAFAVHKLTGVKSARIELYGIEMESDTEYSYQLPGGAFLIGLAEGRGIQVVRPEPSELCRASVYGWETVPYVDRSRLVELLDFYSNELSKRTQALNDFLASFDPNSAEHRDKYLELSAWQFEYQGAVLVLEKILNETPDTYIAREGIEMRRARIANDAELWKGLTNQNKSAFDIAFKEGKGDAKVFTPLWEEYIKSRANMYAYTAAGHVLLKLLKLADMRHVDFNLEMWIREA